MTEKVTDQERTLLRLLEEEPGYTVPRLAVKIGISRKTVAARLKSLKEKGVIERIGSDRKGRLIIFESDRCPLTVPAFQIRWGIAP